MVIFIVVGLIVFLTIGYFFLMFFYPEWVGISGEDTQKSLEAHRDEKLSDINQVNDKNHRIDVGNSKE